jgi:hypothetical protein
MALGEQLNCECSSVLSDSLIRLRALDCEYLQTKYSIILSNVRDKIAARSKDFTGKSTPITYDISRQLIFALTKLNTLDTDYCGNNRKYVLA